MTNTTNYLFVILLLGVPLLVLQWAVGLDIFVRRWRVWVLGTLAPAAYVTTVSWLGARRANPSQSLGTRLPIIDVPLEEFLVLLVASLLVVQGLMLALYFPLVIRRTRALVALIRRGPPRPPVPPAAE